VVILHGTSIKQHGIIVNSFGAARAPWIGAQDAAEVAVQQLMSPPPATAVVTYPPGAAALSHTEIAEVISAETARNIQYRPVPEAQWRELIEAQIDRSETPVNAAMAQHISAIGAGFASGNGPVVKPDPGALAATLGREPVSFAAFVRQHRHEFTGATGSWGRP